MEEKEKNKKGRISAPETAVGIGSSKLASVRTETRATQHATDRDSPNLLSKQRESHNPLNDLDLRIRCPICGGFIDPETSMTMCGECFKRTRGKEEMWDGFNKWLRADDKEVLDAYNAKSRLEAVKTWFSERVEICETAGMKYLCCSGKDLDELKRILGAAEEEIEKNVYVRMNPKRYNVELEVTKVKKGKPKIVVPDAEKPCQQKSHDSFDELISEICADIDALREKLKPIWEKARNWDCIDWSDTPLLEKTMKKKIELERSLEAIKKLMPELVEILNMDWIWLTRKSLDRLLRWKEKLYAVLGVVEEER